MYMQEHWQRRFWLFVNPSLIALAFLLQLLVSLSVPLIKPIHLFSLNIHSSSSVANNGELRFGLWGFCMVNVYDESIWDYGDCSKPQIGYDLDPYLLSLIGLSAGVGNLISKVLTSFLVLHPTVAFLTWFAGIPGTFILHKATRILSLCLNVLTAILSTFVTAIDFAIIIVARSQLAALALPTNPKITLSLSIGPAPWMALLAVISLWAAVIVGSAISCECCGPVRWEDQYFGGNKYWTNRYRYRYHRPGKEVPSAK